MYSKKEKDTDNSQFEGGAQETEFQIYDDSSFLHFFFVSRESKHQIGNKTVATMVKVNIDDLLSHENPVDWIKDKAFEKFETF